jgi:hypothetical protein
MGLIALAVAGCRPAPPIRLSTTQGAAGRTLTLLADSGYQINARLAPALELPGGQVIRFTSPHLTPDSDYFAAPPVAWLAGDNISTRGTLRAGVCRVGETVCRVVAVEVALSREQGHEGRITYDQ